MTTLTLTKETSYYWWFDWNPKVSDADKVADAIEAYTHRFRHAPNVALVWNGCDVPPMVAGCAVRVETYIRKDNIWVGYETN